MLIIRRLPPANKVHAHFFLFHVRLCDGIGKVAGHCSVVGGVLGSCLCLGCKDAPREPCTSHSAPLAMYCIENAAQNACLEFLTIFYTGNHLSSLGLLATLLHSSALIFAEQHLRVLHPSKCLCAFLLTKGGKCLAVRLCRCGCLCHSLRCGRCCDRLYSGEGFRVLRVHGLELICKSTLSCVVCRRRVCPCRPQCLLLVVLTAQHAGHVMPVHFNQRSCVCCVLDT